MKRVGLALFVFLLVITGVSFADTTTTSSADFSWSLSGALANPVVAGGTEPLFNWGSYYQHEFPAGVYTYETYQNLDIPGGPTTINQNLTTNSVSGTGSAAFGTNATYSAPFHLTGNGNIYANTTTVRDPSHDMDYSGVYNTVVHGLAWIDYTPVVADTAILNLDVDWDWSFANILKPLTTDWQGAAEIGVYSSIIMSDAAGSQFWSGQKKTELYMQSYGVGAGSGGQLINFDLDINPFSDGFSYTKYVNGVDVPWNDAFTPYFVTHSAAIYVTAWSTERGTPTDGGNVVPEPASLSLLGLGLLGIVLKKKRKIL